MDHLHQPQELVKMTNLLDLLAGLLKKITSLVHRPSLKDLRLTCQLLSCHATEVPF